jgi:hypothetical protein
VVCRGRLLRDMSSLVEQRDGENERLQLIINSFIGQSLAADPNVSMPTSLRSDWRASRPTTPARKAAPDSAAKPNDRKPRRQSLPDHLPCETVRLERRNGDLRMLRRRVACGSVRVSARCWTGGVRSSRHPPMPRQVRIVAPAERVSGVGIGATDRRWIGDPAPRRRPWSPAGAARRCTRSFAPDVLRCSRRRHVGPAVEHWSGLQRNRV